MVTIENNAYRNKKSRIVPQNMALPVFFQFNFDNLKQDMGSTLET